MLEEGDATPLLWQFGCVPPQSLQSVPHRRLTDLYPPELFPNRCDNRQPPLLPLLPLLPVHTWPHPPALLPVHPLRKAAALPHVPVPLSLHLGKAAECSGAAAWFSGAQAHAARPQPCPGVPMPVHGPAHGPVQWGSGRVPPPPPPCERNAPVKATVDVVSVKVVLRSLVGGVSRSPDGLFAFFRCKCA